VVMIRQRQLGVLAAPVVCEVLGHEQAQSQTFIQLAHRQQAAVGGPVILGNRLLATGYACGGRLRRPYQCSRSRLPLHP